MSIEKLPIKRWSLFTCVVDQLILTLARGSRPWDGGIFWPPVHCGRERGTSWTVHYTPFQCTFAHSPKTGLCPLKKYYIYCLKLIERENEAAKLVVEWVGWIKTIQSLFRTHVELVGCRPIWPMADDSYKNIILIISIISPRVWITFSVLLTICVVLYS